MTKHDDLQVLVYKNDFWNNNIENEWIVLYEEHELEVPLIKGDGEYKKIIGYIDYIIRYTLKHKTRTHELSGNPIRQTRTIGIELKTTKESIGETLRQIKRYKIFSKDFDCFILIGDCMLEYKDILKDHEIYMIEEKEFKK